jgi:F-type H+-transporting ATPase subunit gamma
MAGLKELRTRISSIASTQKITSAMKMVAAARLKHAQDMLQKSQAYHHDLTLVMERLVGAVTAEAKKRKVTYLMPAVMNGHSDPKVYQLVVFSSDKGLCGSYNAMVLKETLRRISELLAEGKQVKVMSLGKKAGESVAKRYPDLEVKIVDGFAAKGADYAETEALVSDLVAQYGQAFDVCEVVSTSFRSAVSREVRSNVFLPLSIQPNTDDSLNWVGGSEYGYEENKLEMIFDLAPLYLVDVMFQHLINAQAGEHGARMAAMDNATRNAHDMISHLTLKYNRLRQSAITTELIEIISGAEAL